MANSATSRQAQQDTRPALAASYALQEKYSLDLQGRLTDLGIWLRSKFDEVAAARKTTEERWLKDLRQYRGRYEASEWKKLTESKHRSRTFCKMTRKKVKAYDGRMMDMLFPTGKDRNWDIKPTPKPDPVLTPVAQRMILERQQALFMEEAQRISAQQGLPPEQVVERLQLGGFVPEIDNDTLN